DAIRRLQETDVRPPRVGEGLARAGPDGLGALADQVGPAQGLLVVQRGRALADWLPEGEELEVGLPDLFLLAALEGAERLETLLRLAERGGKAVGADGFLLRLLGEGRAGRLHRLLFREDLAARRA